MRGLQDGLQPNLDKDEYKEPKFIAAGVLKRAIRELNERADLTFRYEPIKEALKLVGWALRAIPNTPTITLSSGAAAAKRREEKREEEPIARTSGMPAVFLQNARERWMNLGRSWLDFQKSGCSSLSPADLAWSQ
jgi:hypothetical protein